MTDYHDDDVLSRLQRFVDDALPDPDQRTPNAHVSILQAYDIGGTRFGRKADPKDGDHAESLAKHLRAAMRSFDRMSPDARVEILLAAIERPAQLSPYLQLKLLVDRIAPEAERFSEIFPDRGGPYDKRAKVAAVADACRKVWQWRTGKQAATEVSSETRTEFEHFVAGVFAIMEISTPKPQTAFRNLKRLS